MFTEKCCVLGGDRRGLETICLLLALKVEYKLNIHMIRGNHEASDINALFGFRLECVERLGESPGVWAWQRLNSLFNWMPLAASIESKILCMHGGLSPQLDDLQKINQLQRPLDVPEQGLLCDLLWADPEDGIDGFMDSDRGVSYLFGENIVGEFLDLVDMDLIVRAHQVMERGYAFFAQRQLVTLFSAPCYCGEFDNAAAVMTIDERLQCSFVIIPAKLV